MCCRRGHPSAVAWLRADELRGVVDRSLEGTGPRSGAV